MRNKYLFLIMSALFLIVFSSLVLALENNGSLVTREDALLAINSSNNLILEMQSKGFSVISLNDSLISAKQVFEQARYAEILRNVNSSERDKLEARNALRLIKWQDITYSDVLVFTEGISTKKEKAFLVLDEISVAKSKLDFASNGTKLIFDQVQVAFSEERYDDVENFLSQFNLAVEKDRVDSSTLAGLKNGVLNFFQRYWIHIILVVVILVITGYFLYKRFEKNIFAGRIKKMKIQEQVLGGLIKRTQEERFKENKISSLVYNIRMKKYDEKMSEIKEELPVLEDRLRKLR